MQCIYVLTIFIYVNKQSHTGYRYLVMDRMSAPLHDIVSILLQDNKSSSTLVKIPIGDIAIQMLRCIQSLHSTGLVFIDVKSDNFMLAPPNNSKKNALAQRIRLIDFGLVESINDMTTAKHREDVEGSPLVGTPTYASLNVMEGHVPSRRDDLEALGYVICEVILNLVASDKKGGKSKKKGSSDTDNLLPWSKATSDVELLNFKKQEMDVKKRSKSQLFTMLKACGSDVVMGNYFNNVMALKYAATPDYESLCCYLKKLIVTVQSSNSVASAKSKSPVRKSPVRRSVTGKHHAKDEESDDDVIVIENPKSMAKSPVRKSPHCQVSSKTPKNQQSDDVANDDNWNKKPAAKTKKQKVATAETASAPRRSTRNKSAREIATQTDPEDWMEVQDNESDPSSMDWEKVESDENEPPLPAAAAVAKKACLALEIIEGPHQGQVFSMGGDYNNVIVVGKDPKANVKPSTRDAFDVSLPGDESASSLHAKFDLTSKKTVHSIKVTDMSSTNGTFVNGSMLAKGKSKQAFPGDRIKIGDSVFKINKC